MKFGVVPAHGPTQIGETIEQVRLCEQLGIDSVWIEEHHASGPYWPTPFLALAALASHTERVILGTNILILPLYDPVHVAEQMAVLDTMTGGRMVLAVALGDSAREFAMFRVQAKGRGAAFEEQIQVIRALWSGQEIDFDGEAFQYKGVGLSVLPIQEGGPPIWIGGWGPRQIERAAALGDAWFPGPVADLPGVVERLGVYEQHLASMGKDPSTRTRPLTRDVVLAEESEAAWHLAEQDLLPSYYETYLDSDHPLVGRGSGTQFESLRELARDRFIIGDPETVAGEVARCIRTTNTDHFVFRLKLPGITPDIITRAVGLLGQEVIPTLRSELGSS